MREKWSKSSPSQEYRSHQPPPPTPTHPPTNHTHPPPTTNGPNQAQVKNTAATSGGGASQSTAIRVVPVRTARCQKRREEHTTKKTIRKQRGFAAVRTPCGTSATHTAGKMPVNGCRCMHTNCAPSPPPPPPPPYHHHHHHDHHHHHYHHHHPFFSIGGLLIVVVAVEAGPGAP